MRRREYLRAGVGLSGVALTGCLGFGGPAETTPLADTFLSDIEPTYWTRSLAGDITIASASSLYTIAQTDTQATLHQFSEDESENWRKAIDAATSRLPPPGKNVYLFRGPEERGTLWLGARNPDSGEHLWDREIGPHPSFIGSSGESVFVGSTTDDPGPMPVHAYDADSGETLWREVTPMPRGGAISHGLCLIYGYPDELIALDTASGERQWSRKIGTERRPNDISSVTVVGETLIASIDDGAVGFSLPDGSEEWTWNGRLRRVTAPDSGGTRPDTIYLEGWEGTLSAVNPETGEVRWSRSPSFTGEVDRIQGIAVGGQRVVARKGRTLYGFERDDGTEQWRQVLSPFETVYGPAGIDETVFVLTVPTQSEAVLKTFELESGHKKWRHSMPITEPLATRFTIFAGQFVVAFSSGELYGFSPS